MMILGPSSPASASPSGASKRIGAGAEWLAGLRVGQPRLEHPAQEREDTRPGAGSPARRNSFTASSTPPHGRRRRRIQSVHAGLGGLGERRRHGPRERAATGDSGWCS